MKDRGWRLRRELSRELRGALAPAPPHAGPRQISLRNPAQLSTSPGGDRATLSRGLALRLGPKLGHPGGRPPRKGLSPQGLSPTRPASFGPWGGAACLSRRQRGKAPPWQRDRRWAQQVASEQVRRETRGEALLARPAKEAGGCQSPLELRGLGEGQGGAGGLRGSRSRRAE